MESMTKYKAMVLAMTTQGIDVKSALDASEIAIFGIGKSAESQEGVQVKVSHPVNIDRAHWIADAAKKVETRKASSRLESGLLAKRLGVSTQKFNSMLADAGYIKKIALPDKPLKNTGSYSHTWVATKAGELYSTRYVHEWFKDGCPAVYRFKWDEKILELLVSKAR